MMNKVLIIILIVCSVLIGQDKVKKNPVAVLNKAIRKVEFNEGKKDWEKATPGLTLFNKNLLRTGKKSLAIVSFLDGSILRVRESSEVTIYGDKEKQKLDKNVIINNGVIGFDVKKQQNEEFKFTTPTLVASIRGTSGYIEVSGEGNTLFALETGLVELQALLGAKSSGTLRPGNTAQVDKNGNLRITETDLQTQQKIKSARQVKTKVIRVRTENGIVEIEYLSDEE